MKKCVSATKPFTCMKPYSVVFPLSDRNRQAPRRACCGQDEKQVKPASLFHSCPLGYQRVTR